MSIKTGYCEHTPQCSGKVGKNIWFFSDLDLDDLENPSVQLRQYVGNCDFRHNAYKITLMYKSIL